MSGDLYDPTTAQFLNRDPIESQTRSAYGYAGNNPLNNTDPTGLNKCEVGANPLRWAGNSIDCGSKVTRNSAATVEVLGGIAAWAATEVASRAVTGAAEHLGGSAMACLGYCIGLEVQNGTVYVNRGGPGWIFGASVGPNYYTKPLDEWCGHGDVGGWGPFGVSQDSTGHNRSVGVGYGSIFGATDTYSTPLAP